jgi:hypothetical protein
MIKVVQRHCGDPGQRLAWDPGITGLSIPLIEGGERILAGGSHLDFPVSFSIEGSTSLEGDSLRSCSTHYGNNMCNWWRPCWSWYELGG